jgi:hypothetical protein
MKGSKPMTRILAGLLLAVALATTAAAGDDLNRYIADKAVTCWATPTAMRGIRFDATFDVRFTRDGHVDVIQIAEFAPETETFHALALDLASAVKRCGPYATEGMRDITLTISWPM